jgi:hypothetical protein
MADDMAVGSVGASKVDTAKWKKLTPQEIIKEESNGEDIPAEILTWAQQMAAFEKIPDDVTYEQVDGDTGLDALAKLGIEEEPPVGAEDGNAIAPEKPEEPGAVKDVAQDEEVEDEDEQNIFMNPPAPEKPNGDEPVDDEEKPDTELGLADPTLTSSDEAIRRRKERKGLNQ